MFKKVLIADDLGSINQGVLTVVNALGITNVQQAQYCDDAYLKIKKAILDKTAFDLLITDLSFKADYREQIYPSGETLVEALSLEHPDLNIIVYSVDDRLPKVRSLIATSYADAYVCKGRKGLIELTEAIKSVNNKKHYLSPQVAQALNTTFNLEIDNYDIELVKQLSLGFSQGEISKQFEKSNVSPSSLSSVEKRLNKLKDQFKANNAIHLVAIVKDLGLI
jgi:DNA-binding NarL/FixJ family response regulator